jgi:hypothetical protein
MIQHRTQYPGKGPTIFNCQKCPVIRRSKLFAMLPATVDADMVSEIHLLLFRSTYVALQLVQAVGCARPCAWVESMSSKCRGFGTNAIHSEEGQSGSSDAGAHAKGTYASQKQARICTERRRLPAGRSCREGCLRMRGGP